MSALRIQSTLSSFGSRTLSPNTSRNKSTSSPSSINIENNNPKHLLKNMVRIFIAVSFIFCLYFLIVCVLTHRNPTTASEPSIHFKYETGNPPAEMLIQVNDADGNGVDLKNSPNIRQPKSIKLSRLLMSKSVMKKTSEDPTTYSKRYSVVDHRDQSSKDSYSDCGYHLAFTLIERDSNEQLYASKLMTKFSNTLTSILLNVNSTKLDPGSLCIHLITDNVIQPYLRQTIAKVHEELSEKAHRMQNMPYPLHHYVRMVENEHHRPLTKYFFIDSEIVESSLEYLLPTLRMFFTHKPNSYYSNALFFYSMMLHKVIPSTIADRLILLDVDIQLDANILELFEEFGRFKPEEVIGIAYEQQPVYRHILHEYRNSTVNTTAGSPPPNGFPGFNSGVVMLHLRKLRESKLYNSLLNPVMIKHLCQKYRFRGHLGDQDFYTLAGLDPNYKALFHVLPCGWNRQLCQWWRFHGYGKVFDDYHRCDTQVWLYHGNCNSALPTLTYYGEYRRR